MTDRSIHAAPATDFRTLGVLATSRKKHERRLPIHPLHFERIEDDLRARMVVEEGYGARFGVSDATLRGLVAAVLPRAEVLSRSDIVVLPKPQAADLAELRDGQTLWGWPHCVQDPELTQLAIDNKLTLIAFEAMNHWTREGSFALHVFHKNNEIAGYAAVLHALELVGSSGDYGRRLNAVVIGFGATARGAVTALNALGVHDVTVLTSRERAAVSAPIHSATIVQFAQDDDGAFLSAVLTDDGRKPLAPFLAQHDIVVNCSLQDPNDPMIYVTTDDLALFTPGSLLIDVSCDEAMGFEWAKMTTFDEPLVEVGDHISYYAVDHTPSHLWNSATWEISEALLPFLRTVMDGPTDDDQNETIRRAVEIRDGVIQNPAILAFQHRAAAYPHEVSPG
ncbi:N(5)-(carboxyethyl)ornithine synthase [Mycetocola zhadangensis]|uniref:Alanine dehydrogenase n=1 Tax=Mycetocola zhadangensis TaxID=1164595 RepID=A0A3L7J6C1_9MICO|nr:N(5)-(carboxyethyl)ornithine synthase [Mycetocola zhadangensis]RLQ86070.1 alanine dehydrogenase [Mycetocola zhadangensis]GGE88136.1 alanine dehydrogenase [Mycetocola zhadangensis]